MWTSKCWHHIVSAGNWLRSNVLVVGPSQLSGTLVDQGGYLKSRMVGLPHSTAICSPLLQKAVDCIKQSTWLGSDKYNIWSRWFDWTRVQTHEIRIPWLSKTGVGSLIMGYVTLGKGVRIPVRAITFSCTAIHFPQLCITYSVIKGQFLSYHAYMVWEVKGPLSR